MDVASDSRRAQDSDDLAFASLRRYRTICSVFDGCDEPRENRVGQRFLRGLDVVDADADAYSVLEERARVGHLGAEVMLADADMEVDLLGRYLPLARISARRLGRPLSLEEEPRLLEEVVVDVTEHDDIAGIRHPLAGGARIKKFRHRGAARPAESPRRLRER
jgi:hypothetical protein